MSFDLELGDHMQIRRNKQSQRILACQRWQQRVGPRFPKPDHALAFEDMHIRTVHLICAARWSKRPPEEIS
jgi:hypothetical protein